MSHAAALAPAIEAAWDARDTITPDTGGEARAAIETVLEGARQGRDPRRRAAARTASGRVNQWVKKAVLLCFRLRDMGLQPGGPQGGGWWDKVDSKFHGWSEHDWRDAGFRAVPTAVVRRSAYIAPGVMLMPSFVNLGAYVGRGHDGRHLGHGRLLRADRQAGASVGRRRHRRRARADAGGADDHRGRLLHRRALGGGRGLHRARGLGARHGRVHRPVDQDRRPRHRRGDLRRGAALFGGGGRRAAGQAAAQRRARAEPLLRRHRQAGRRAHPVEDRRSTNCCATEPARAGA